MNFLVDAQLPRRISWWMHEHGHDVVHTLDLPEGNQTADFTLIEIADAENRIVVTKDTDFVNSFHLRRKPHKLLLVATGNITNPELEHLLVRNIGVIVTAFETANFVEINRTGVIVRD
jgi:predicted nuclease of predicted toxin-antitoxin system